jgi:hypothetical protein
MSFGADEEILQDFLVEAGEILEQLSEQLVSRFSHCKRGRRLPPAQRAGGVLSHRRERVRHPAQG